MTKLKLPIDEHLGRIVDVLGKSKNLILKASAGSGKTTRVPPALLRLTSKQIWILEPRRLAAKFAARRVADEMDIIVGDSVGYAFRFEREEGNNTKILFLTEGTFLKRVVNDPELSRVEIIILDEFHERHRETDLALAYITQLQREKRPDLKIVIMSATLNMSELPTYLGACEQIEVEAPVYPLEIKYKPMAIGAQAVSLEKLVVLAIGDALEFPGDILVFLPGIREIRQVADLLLARSQDFSIFILHGDMNSADQSEVMAISSKRKIILSTNVAESSLTIPGVQIVIDSGLYRESRVSPQTGLSQLTTRPISKSSGIQRAGRANRTGPGVVYRLYSKEDFFGRPEFVSPEILRSDLCESVLLFLYLGVNPITLPLLDPPSSENWQKAFDLLEMLGAISLMSEKWKISELGKMILDIPSDPRIARALIEAAKDGREAAQMCAAFISNNLDSEGNAKKSESMLLRSLKYNQGNTCRRELANILLFAFPDRVGKIRRTTSGIIEVLLSSGEQFLLSSQLRENVDVNHQLWLVLLCSGKNFIEVMLPVEEEWLWELQPLPIREEVEWFYNIKEERVQRIQLEKIGQISLHKKIVGVQWERESLDNQLEIKKVIVIEVMKKLEKLKSTSRFQRLRYLEDKSEADFDLQLSQSLNQFAEGRDSLKDVEEELLIFLEQHWSDKMSLSFGEIDRLLPLDLQLRDKRSLKINYDYPREPWIEGYIQDFYGMTSCPTIMKGSFTLTLHLLGPHKRALQVTKDLNSFWTNTYHKLKKELERDYPRHHWPMDPASARPILLKRQL